MRYVKTSNAWHPSGVHGFFSFLNRRSSLCSDLRLLSGNPPGCLVNPKGSDSNPSGLLPFPQFIRIH